MTEGRRLSLVATDDARIRDHAQGFGAEVVMTSPDCRNGTERCAEVARLLRLNGREEARHGERVNEVRKRLGMTA